MPQGPSFSLAVAAVFMFMTLATGGEAVESKVTMILQPPAVVIDVTIAHKEPMVLTYGFLFPAVNEIPMPVGVVVRIFNIRLPRLPRAVATCDVNRQWFGACETVVLAAGGGRISAAIPIKNIHELKRGGVEKFILLLKGEDDAEPQFHEASVSEILQKLDQVSPAPSP